MCQLILTKSLLVYITLEVYMKNVCSPYLVGSSAGIFKKACPAA